MKFDNSIKGKVTQALIETILENAAYKVVPLGIEEIIREVKELSEKKYLQLNLSKSLRKLPDFFVSNSDMSNCWLVEVKYRKRWSESMKNFLKDDLKEQVNTWSPLTLILILGEKGKENETPSSYLGAIELVLKDDELVMVKKTTHTDLFEDKKPNITTTFKAWDKIEWSDFNRIQDTFSGVSDKWDEATIKKSITILKQLYEIEKVK